ncbi:MAG: hypothetical protein JJW00_08175 [Sulfurimonas sp.]|nr:hypothetical protein [Sulfurimonas sp.]
MLKILVKIFLVLFLAGAVVLGAWYLTYIYSWSIWVGALIVAGIFGSTLALILLRRYLLRNNERNFVKRVIAQEGSSIFANSEEHQLYIDDLETKWAKSIKILHDSNLSKAHNPIYALPWVLVIGNSDAGKTSLIKHSRLSSTPSELEDATRHLGTKNCDWWFFEDAIILDTAGRYTIPIDDKRDNAEWERFLSLLSKYRKKEPLNALVVTVSAQRLLENDKDLIQEDALNIRKRINQLMASIGAKFPVYVMVTKMDKVYGFTSFCESLPKKYQSQAMGYINESLNQHWDEVLDEGLSQVESKIGSLELLMIERGAKEIKELLVFSQEFSLLAPALKDFSKIVFGDNPYQKIPILRGIYFSSALNDGESSSRFLSEFGLSQNPKKPSNKAYFISDFFKTILPNDRNIFTPIKEYLGWQRKNYTIAIVSWILIFSSVVGIYFYSFMQNLEVINNIEKIQKHESNFKDKELTAQLMLLDKLRLDIDKIDILNRNVLLASISFTQSKKAEKNLKKLFHDTFYNHILKKYIFKLDRSIKNINTKTPTKKLASYIGFIMHSISILEQVSQNKADIEIDKHFYSLSQDIFSEEEQKIDPNFSLLFTNSYITFLKWGGDKNFLNEQIKILKNQLAYIIEKKGKNLHWLTDEGVSLTPKVTLGDFWEDIDSELAKNAPSISGSLTIEGRKNIVKNIEILKKVLGDSKELEDHLKLFWKWYDERFYYRWKNFALGFSDGERFLDSSAGNHSTLYSMAGVFNPYFKLMKTMTKEMKAYRSTSDAPEWAKLIIELGDIMDVATNIRHSKKSIMAKVGKEKDKLVAKAQEDIGEDMKIKHIESALLLNNYIEDLTKLSMVVDRKKSQLLVSTFFNDLPGQKAPSPSFSQCQNHYLQFQHSNSKYENTEFVYKIMEGPKNYIINYSIKNMDSILNTQWENSVLGLIPPSSDMNLLMLLFDQAKGLVWKYVDGILKPFVQLNQYGYKAKVVSGFKLDIKPSFLHYINSGITVLGVYKSQYNINITTLPFDTNKKAKLEANYVTLHLRCAEGDYLLENDNYKHSKDFLWSPSKCGDTVLSFGFKDFEITKTYKGDNGFLHFLRDFRDGTKIFTSKDFDTKAPELAQYNIKWIKLNYNIKDVGNMLKLLDKTPYNLPKDVTNSKQ